MLENTAYRLRNGTGMTVAYFGGSITEGAGSSSYDKCWAGRTTAWLRERWPECEINHVQAAIGALTIINANTELIEKESGPSDNTASINRQVKKMIALVKEIGSLAIFESENPAVTKVNLSSTLSALAEYSKSRFEEKGISLDYDIEDNIIIDGEEENLKRMLSELIENAVKYSLGEAHFTLKKEKDRVLLTQSNDTSLSADSIEQIFDRFTTLENADNTDSVGLGLSYVKDIVTSHNGRVSAKVKDGMFMLTIAL